MRCVAYIGATLGLFVSFAHGQDTPPTSIDRCDQLAASDLDRERPASVPGVPVSAVDADAAVPACEAAVASAAGNRRLIYQLGRAYYVAKDYEKARVEYARADALGHVGAAHNLGALFANGSGVSRDRAEARRLFEKAAAAGFAMSMYNLGREFEIDRDFAQARQWYAKAAELGFDSSFIKLGQLFDSEQDYVEARRWYEKAAVNGDHVAMTSLGVLYMEGRGVPRDQHQARLWYRRAAELGNPGASALLEMMDFDRPDSTYDQSQRRLEGPAARSKGWAKGSASSTRMGRE